MSLGYTHFDEVHTKTLLQELWRQHKSEEFCDVVLIVGTEEKRIPAHRCILSAASGYLKGILLPTANDSISNDVKITGVNADAFASLIEYCYTGNMVIQLKNIVDLLITADMLLLGEVVEACSHYLAKQLHPTNCLGFGILAKRCHCPSLLQQARVYILEHYLDVCQTDEFLSLSAAQLSQLLGNDDLAVASEEDVFHSLLTWLNQKRTEREQDLAELLKLVRLPLLERSFLIENVKPVCVSMECCQIYMEAIECQLSKPEEMPEERKAIKKRKNQYMIGLTRSDSNKKMHFHFYSTQQSKWMKWIKDLQYRRGIGVALAEHSFFVIGGTDDADNILNTTICLNLNTLQLSELQAMSEYRSHCGAAVLNGALYAVGGFNGNIELNSVEKWNSKTNQWNKVASMSVGRHNFGIAVLEEKLYAFGGQNSAGGRKSAERYDALQNVWEPIASMNECRQLPGAVVHNGLLYAVGGADIKTVECYDPKSNCWTAICCLNEVLSKPMTCAAVQNKIIICYSDRVEVYDERINAWEPCSSQKGLVNIFGIFPYPGELLTSEFV